MTDPDDVVLPSEVAEVDAQPTQAGADAMPGADVDQSSNTLVDMLTSTEPPVSPREADGALAPGVPWYKDMEAFMQKASGSAGTPAVVHAIVAGVKIANGAGVREAMPTGGGDDSGAETGSQDVVTFEEV